MLRVIPFPIKETWSHEFCCIPKRDQTTTPTAGQVEQLNKAGMGKKKIKFNDKYASHFEVVTILEDNFPELKNCGGFTLHRSKSGGYNRPLTKLSTTWYDIKKIRKEVSSSACIYIKPLQKDLDMVANPSQKVSRLCAHFWYIKDLILIT